MTDFASALDEVVAPVPGAATTPAAPAAPPVPQAPSGLPTPANDQFGAALDEVAPLIRPTGAEPIGAREMDEQRDAFVNLLEARKTSPDVGGRAIIAAQESGLPVDVAQRNIDTVEGDLYRARDAQVLKSAKATAQFFSDSRNAAVAHDRVAAMGFWEKQLEAAKQGVSEAIESDNIRPLLLKQANDPSSLTPAEKVLIDGYHEHQKQPSGIDEWSVPAGVKLMASFTAGLTSQMTQAGYAATTAGLTTGTIAGVTLGPEAAPVGALAGGIGGFEVSLFSQGMDAGIAQTSDRLLQLRDEKGAALSPWIVKGASGFVGAITGALNILMMGKAAAPVLGQGTSDVVSMLTRTTIEKLAESPSMARAAAAMVGSTAKGTAMGAAFGAANGAASIGGETLATEINNLLNGTKFATIRNDPERLKAAWGEMLDNVVGMAGPLGGLHFGGGALAVGAEAVRVRRAAADARFYDALVAGSLASGLVDRPAGRDAIQRFLGITLDDGPHETVYVPASKLVELYQDAGRIGSDSDPIFPGMEGLQKQVADALPVNGDVAIPAKDFFARLAGTPALDALKGDLRMRQDGLSLNEARAALKEREAVLKESQARWEAESADGNVADPATRVYEHARDMLTLGSGFTQTAASHQAALWAAHYEARAARSPHLYSDAWDAFQKAGTGQGVDVRTVVPERLRVAAPDHLDVLLNSLRSGKDPALPEAPPSLLDWISARGGVLDAGGELKARDLDKWHLTPKGRPRKGVNPIIAEAGAVGQRSMFGKATVEGNKLTLHDTAQAAWEDGFFPDRVEPPTQDDLLRAIDDELGGRRNVSEQEPASPRDVFRGDRALLDETLNRLGIDVKTATNKQVREALEAAARTDDEKPTYDQSAAPLAPAFFSGVERALEVSKQAKATAAQWLGMLKNAPGVKPEEMKWLGLDDWLKAQTGAVTKDQIAAYVRANQLKISETVRGVDIEAMYQAAKATARERGFTEDRIFQSFGQLTNQTEPEYARHGELGEILRPVVEARRRRAGETAPTEGDVEEVGLRANAILEHQGFPRDAHGEFPHEAFDNAMTAADLELRATDEDQARQAIEAGYEEDVQRLKNHGIEFNIGPPGEALADQHMLFSEGEHGDFRDAAEIAAGRLPNGEREFPEEVARAAARLEQALARIIQTAQPDGVGLPTKYATYQLPGGKNYRELLLRLPEKPNPHDVEADRLRAELADAMKAWRDAGEEFGTGSDQEMAARERHAALERDAAEVARQQRPMGEVFRGSHWDEANVLAHIRFNDRTIGGKRTLFIEEVQSDWHQKGRKQGYSEPLLKAADLTFDEIQPGTEDQEKPKFWFKMPEGRANELGDNRVPGWGDTPEAARADALRNANMSLKAKNGMGVPDAPFKTTWPELSMKRMIRYAAEHGYEAIAWPPGAVHVDRYSQALRKSIDHLEWKKTPEGIHLVGYKGGSRDVRTGRLTHEILNAEYAQWMHDQGLNIGSADEHVNDENLTETQRRWLAGFMGRWNRTAIDHAESPRTKVVDTTEKETALSDAIGKAMAKKIVEDERQSGVISGADIKVDDTGMAGFYDRILPATVSKLVKKFGAKVGAGKLETGENDYGPLRVASDGTRYWLEDREGATVSSVYDSAAEAMDEREALQAGAQSVHLVDVNPAMRQSATEQGFSLFQDGKRGSIKLGDGRALIQLFQTRDLSTLLHETGHLWLEELRVDALRPGASVEMAESWAATLKHLGIDAATWDGEFTRDQHEKFARSFETYLMEGKAPSTQLASAFRAFKNWLVQIYRKMSALDAPLSPEMRDVFDRLVATEDEIKAAREQQSLNPLFKDAASAGMSETQFRAYTDRVTQALNDAEQRVLEKAMAGIRAKRTREWKAAEKETRAQVRQEVMQDPGQQALYFLRTGKIFDGETPKAMEGLKLSKADLLDMYGDETALQMVPRGIYREEGGMSADSLAEVMGFNSGREMVDALMHIEAQRQAMAEKGDKRSVLQAKVAEETVDRMNERMGGHLDEQAIAEEAMAAVHSDQQAALLGAELQALGRRAGKPAAISVDDVKEWAAKTVGEMPARAAQRFGRYLKAERTAGRAAEKALMKGDYVAAFKAKQDQLANSRLYLEAKKAADDIDSARRALDRYAGARTIGNMDQGYLEQIHGLLEDYDFKRRTDKEIARTAGFELWAANQSKEGVDGVGSRLSDRMKAQVGKLNYRDLTVDEVRGLRDTVDQVAKLGRLAKELTLNQEKREFDAVLDELHSQLQGLPQIDAPAERNPGQAGAGVRESQRAWQVRAASGARLFDASLLKMERLIDWMDANNSRGLANSAIFKPLADAQGRENDMLAVYAKKMQDSADAVPAEVKKTWRKRIDVPELRGKGDGRGAFLKSDLIAIALNLGNESNKTKLLEGDGWTEEAVKAALDKHLVKADWEWIQRTWDIINDLWPEAAEVERRVNGVEAPKIEAATVVTPFGDFRGGYYPAAYDVQMSPEARAAWERRGGGMFDEGMGYVRATTSQGYQKARTGFSAPLLLDLSVVPRHLAKVIHDITHREAVRQVNKIVLDKRFIEGMDAAFGPEYTKLFVPWLKSIAGNAQSDDTGIGWWMGTVKALRTNASMVGMGIRGSTMIQQITGNSDTAEVIGAKWMLAGNASFVGDPAKMVQTRDFVFANSAEMRHRMDNTERDIREGLRSLLGKNDALSEVRRFAYYGIGMFDMAVSLPAWMGGYKKGLSEGMSHEDASYYADKVVRQSQGAGGVKDLAAVQSHGNEFMKLFSMFYSWASHFYNQQRNIGRDASAAWADRGEGHMTRDFAMIAARSFWLMVIPALAGPLMTGQGPQEDESWGAWATRNVGFGLFAGVPVVRDLASTANSYMGNGFGSWGVTPVARGFESAWSTIKDVAPETFANGQSSDKWIKHSLETAGYLFGLPTGQLGGTTQFLWDLHTGNQTAQSAGEWYRGLLTGRANK